MKFTKIKDLKYGDCFIWGDDYTRQFMCVDEEHDRLAPLIFDRVEDSSALGPKVWFLNANQDEVYLYFDSRCRVIVAKPVFGDVMHGQVRCNTCGGRLHKHQYMKCNSVDAGYFSPVEDSLMHWHGEAFNQMSHDEFFESIGL